MKKLLAILLAAACAFSLAACAAAPDTPAAEEQPDCISDPTTQQLAAPVEAAMAQYPNEAKYTASNGNFDSEKYDEDWDAWWESYQEKTADMTDPAAMTHWFTTSIPALMQDAGKENRVCSPLNIYMALSMLAAVTDGQTRQQILDALGAESRPRSSGRKTAGTTGWSRARSPIPSGCGTDTPTMKKRCKSWEKNSMLPRFPGKWALTRTTICCATGSTSIPEIC